MEVLKITNLTKDYGKLRALDNLNLTIESGNVYGLLGPNGSGKTTTLGIILGILSKTSGEFEWFNGQYGEHYRLKIGSILETPNFYPYLDADTNLKIVAKIKNASDVDYDGLLGLVGLKARRKSKFQTYSLGMKQRLAIAATLIGDPEVVIFDEPTNGLDPQGIAEVRSILKSIADTGKTVLMASHILDEVEKICSHVAIIKSGKLLAVGPIGKILSNKKIMEINASDREKLHDFLKTIPSCEIQNENKDFIECLIDQDLTAESINRMAYDYPILLSHLVVKKQRLEQEFLQITQNA
jgi:ABC-2 type transport system ATP-binding protein